MKKLISAMFFAVLAATAAMADALDTTLFAKKSDITVSGYAGSTPLANFPVLVRLAANSPDGFDYAECAADGSDLRFADANGDLIPRVGLFRCQTPAGAEARGYRFAGRVEHDGAAARAGAGHLRLDGPQVDKLGESELPSAKRLGAIARAQSP